MKLTAPALNSLPEGDYTDHIIPGLTFRVGKKRRTWIVRYRTGAKQHKPTLGYYVPNAPAGSDSLGLAEAREKAREILGRVEAGVPAAEEKPVHPKDALTLGAMISEYEKMRRTKAASANAKDGKAKAKNRSAKDGKIKTLDEALRAVRKGLNPYLHLPAAAFAKRDMLVVRDKIAKTAPQSSDRFLAYCGPVWRWAAQEDKVPVNFIPDVLKTGPGLVQRERVLTADELRAIWKACAAFGEYGRLVRFLMVLGIRRGEGAAIRHGRVIDGRWKLTKEETKAGRDHLVKLPKLALDQLGQGAAGDLVFPGRGGANVMISGWAKRKALLDERCGVSDWRLHDLRRTCASEMQALDIQRDTISAILNHAIPGVDGHYLHASLEKQKAKAWDTWAAHLAKIVGIRAVS